MTRMLASVIDWRELESAIEAGVDIIDLKNPHTGALGALPIESIRNLVTRCGGRCPVSATVGDLPADPQQLTQAIGRTAECGVDYVKVGFFSTENLTRCLQAIAGLTHRHKVVAVLFADREPPLERLGEFAASGFRGVMLDTAEKGGGGLLDCMDPNRLERFVSEVRALDMLSGLAGSLRLEDIPQLHSLLPDYLGFRGALCEGRERTAGIAPHRLRAIHDALAQTVPRRERTVSALSRWLKSGAG
ncbi:MAG: (5-formylfuran-3-yl)methyl phosphate synthase [Candidatus Thiodiazotropha sp. (ex Ctena orbiculata)]|nr:(5-formylfuran-3-yl)methyl phosphate synthase [Candidatus Thiodiazotropha taylori]